MKLYGRQWTRRELEARVGRLEQVGGLRRYTLREGPEAGVEGVRVRTGGGLAYEVLPSRGMDIALAEFAGVPLSWQAPNGEAHPGFYDAREAEWLRTAAGGLLMTCGLTQVGSPSEGEGLHGRAHHLPARQVVAEGRWQGDEYEMRVAGVVEQTRLFGEQLRLTREIRSRLGENGLTLTDTVENWGFAETPHMLLYHFNFGFPLLSEETTIEFPGPAPAPREADTPVEGYDRWQAPQSGYQERVYYHTPTADAEGWAEVRLHNPRFPHADGGGTRPLTLRLRWKSAPLPRLVQWKMPGAGIHVLGIEPANCHVEGRAVERARGTLPTLAPGEQRTYHLAIEIVL